MFKNKYFRILLIIMIVTANIGCDQVSKKMVRENVKPHDRIELINDNFILMNVENTGAFLSTGSNLPKFWKNILLLVLPILMLIWGLGYTFFNTDMSKMGLIGLCFILGGGFGNMIDRIKFGSVTDFLFIDLGGIFRTGVFNMADVSIMVGLGIILLFFITEKTTEL